MVPVETVLTNKTASWAPTKYGLHRFFVALQWGRTTAQRPHLEITARSRMGQRRDWVAFRKRPHWDLEADL